MVGQVWMGRKERRCEFLRNIKSHKLSSIKLNCFMDLQGMMGPPGEDGPLGLEGPQVRLAQTNLTNKLTSTKFSMLCSV